MIIIRTMASVSHSTFLNINILFSEVNVILRNFPLVLTGTGGLDFYLVVLAETN